MVVEILKYIGPFLRMNSLSRENVEKQLLHYAKESFKHIVLNSKCGITTSINDFKVKNIPNFDISTFKKNSPLLCVYKKANPKLSQENNHYKWDEDTFKKEINIYSNAYMTLTLTELFDYYESFKDNSDKLYALGKVYELLSKKQLDFYSSNLRNIEGLFVDKKDCSDVITGDYIFEEKGKKYKFSDQALLMAAYYKTSTLPEIKDAEAYKNFSMDILNMFIEAQNELYNLSFEETNKVCLAINIFNNYSKNTYSTNMIIDLCDLLIDKIDEHASVVEDSIEYSCLTYINLLLAYKSTSLLKFKEASEKLHESLINIYDNDSGIFIKNSDKKELDFSCQDIVLYLVTLLLHSKHFDYDNLSIVTNVFKRQFINSGIVLSWPDAPPLDSPERYAKHSLRSEDLLEEHNFRMPTIATPESNELAPVLIKSIQYSKKKESFSQGKLTFDSTKNMPLLFMIIYLLDDSQNTVTEET